MRSAISSIEQLSGNSRIVSRTISFSVMGILSVVGGDLYKTIVQRSIPLGKTVLRCVNRCSSPTVREGVTEPGADRGPHAGIPRGVVDATGSWTQLECLIRSLPLEVLPQRPCCRAGH